MILDEILEKIQNGEYNRGTETIFYSDDPFDYAEYGDECPYCHLLEIYSDDFQRLENYFKQSFGADGAKWEDECVKWCEKHKICDCYASYNDD